MHARELQQSSTVISPPIEPLGVVALAWALASKDTIYVKWAQDYLSRLVENSKSDYKATVFFKKLMPLLYAVSSKVALARATTRESFKRLDEIRDARLEQLEQISGLGANVKGIITRLAAVVAGGAAAGAIAGSHDVNTTTPTYGSIVLLGTAIGYGLIELILWVYKLVKTPAIYADNEKRKEDVWDEQFTSITHTASITLYEEVLDVIKKEYGLPEIRTRDKAKDIVKMIQMFMQRPTVKKGTVSLLKESLEDCKTIERDLSNIIYSRFSNDFSQLRNEQNKTPVNCRECGIRSLSTFLCEEIVKRGLARESIISNDLHKMIMDLRDIRKKIVDDANYDDLNKFHSLTKSIRDEIRKCTQL